MKKPAARNPAEKAKMNNFRHPEPEVKELTGIMEGLYAGFRSDQIIYSIIQ